MQKNSIEKVMNLSVGFAILWGIPPKRQHLCGCILWSEATKKQKKKEAPKETIQKCFLLRVVGSEIHLAQTGGVLWHQ